MIAYRSLDGSTIFRFEFTRMRNGTLRIYVVNQPDYAGRDHGPHATHRNWDDTGPSICWTEPIHTEDQARAVAKQWSEKTLAYIRHGTRF